jgi:phosphosulfolactate phosphohydrolase-like enzyme
MPRRLSSSATGRVVRIKDRHADTNVAVAQGLAEFQKAVLSTKAFGQELSVMRQVHDALDDFFIAGIGIRVLMGHYMEMSEQIKAADAALLAASAVVGIVNRHVTVQRVAADAANDAIYMCDRHYGFAPEVEFKGAEEQMISYVPTHLYYLRVISIPTRILTCLRLPLRF